MMAGSRFAFGVGVGSGDLCFLGHALEYCKLFYIIKVTLFLFHLYFDILWILPPQQWPYYVKT